MLCEAPCLACTNDSTAQQSASQVTVTACPGAVQLLCMLLAGISWQTSCLMLMWVDTKAVHGVCCSTVSLEHLCWGRDWACCLVSASDSKAMLGLLERPGQGLEGDHLDSPAGGGGRRAGSFSCHNNIERKLLLDIVC